MKVWIKAIAQAWFKAIKKVCFSYISLLKFLLIKNRISNPNRVSAKANL